MRALVAVVVGLGCTQPAPVGTTSPGVKSGAQPSRPDLARYAGFSADGRYFAWAALSHGAGVPVVTILRSQDDAIDARFPLEKPADVEATRGELARRGFGDEGVRVGVGVGRVEVKAGKLAVEVGGAMPATLTPRFVPPGATATLWGTSADGHWAAVQLTGQAQSEFGDVLTYEIVPLQR